MKVFGSIVLLLSFSIGTSFSQHYEKKELYVFFKKRVADLEKQPSSIRRDTLLHLAYDNLIKAHEETDYEYMNSIGDIRYNKHSEQLNAWKIHCNKTNYWQKGIGLYLSASGKYKSANFRAIEAVEDLMKAQKIFENINDKKDEINNLINLSVIFTYHTDTLSPVPYFQKALVLARSIKDTFLIRHALNYYGDYYITRNQYDKAFIYYNEIDKLKSTTEKPHLRYWTNDIYLGLCYVNLNQEKKGLAYIYKAFKTLPHDVMYHRYLHTNTRLELMKFYMSKKEYDKVQKIAAEYDNLPTFSEFYKLWNHSQLYDFKYQVFKQKGDINSALKSLEDLTRWQNHWANVLDVNRAEGIKSQLSLAEQTERLQAMELEKLRSENQRQSQFRWFLIGLIIVGFGIVFWVIRTNRILAQNNEDLKTKNTEISEALLKGQTIERQRVALDLHDNLGSTLSALWLSLDTIDQSKMNDEEKAIHQNLRENLEKAYNDVRLLSHNLLPEEFEKQGLVATLQGLVRKINKSSQIRFDLAISEGFERVSNKVEFELYSICLELVNNILKHSKATEAKIELNRTEKDIKLVVSDNGIGTLKNDSDGKGMKNIKARVESLNGTWEIIPLQNQRFRNEIIVSL